MERAITRRRFLQGTRGVLALSLTQLRCGGGAEQPAGGSTPRSAVESTPQSTAVRRVPSPVAYRNWGDVWRRQWTWDRVAKSAHFVNCWYQRCCCWNVYVKDGLVFREEQSGTSPQIDERIPDFNPRGCQKGACFGRRMYDAGWVRYPLKRAGARGEGKWKRIMWHERRWAARRAALALCSWTARIA